MNAKLVWKREGFNCPLLPSNTKGKNEKKRLLKQWFDTIAKKNTKPKMNHTQNAKSFLIMLFLRLDKCPFKEKKSTCGKCKVHCYRPDMREKIVDNHALLKTKNAFVSSRFAVESSLGWA